MATLYDKLKSIYTSGDDFTVLQLLNELIEATKSITVAETPLYRHCIEVQLESGRVFFSFISKDDTPVDNLFKLLTFLASNPSFAVSGFINETDDDENPVSWPIVKLSKPISALNAVTIVLVESDGSASRNVTPTHIIDTVKSLQEE